VQVGAENRKKLFVAIALMAIAAILLVRFLFNSGSGAPAVTAAAPATSTPTPSASSRRAPIPGKKKAAPARSLDPTLRYDWLKASEDTKYEGTGRNIFRAEVEIPKPIVNPVKDRQQAQVNTPPQPPPPPPINLKFFGYANRPGESKRVFLSEGEDVFVAHEGDIIDRRYRILHINPTSVEVEDVLNNNRQSIPLTQG
jgi:hypothetical protein